MNTPPNNEVSKHIINELELVVHSEQQRLLNDAPYTVTVAGHLPHLPYTVPDIIKAELDNVGLVPDELKGVDTKFSFPTNDPYGAVAYSVTHWHNGVNWTYSATDFGPLAYAGHGDTIVGDVGYFHIDQARQLVEASPLPYELMASSDKKDIEGVVDYFSRTSQQFHQLREKEIALDPFSTLRIVHDALLLKSELTGEPQLVQELRLEAKHYDDFGPNYPAARVARVNTAYPVRAQHIVFHRDLSDSEWKYYASYDGPIKPGDVTGEYDESIERLTPPPVTMSLKIYEALAQISDKKA